MWLATIAYLLASFASGQGFVLCWGPDGHLAVEVRGEGECGGCLDPLRGNGSSIIAAESENECPCVDVPLRGQPIAESRSTEVHSEKLAPTAASSSEVPTIRTSFLSLRRRVRDAIPPAPSAHLKQLHTVVLVV